MTVNRGPGVAPIAGVGTTTVEHRLQLAGLYAENAPGVPRSGVLAQATDLLVVGRADMSYDVGPAAFVISRTAGEGVYTPTLTGTTNVATGAAPGTNSRWDLIYVKQNDQAKGDADNAAVISVQQGTAAASPTKPTADLPAGAYVLAEARIFATTTGTSGGSNTVAQVWRHTAARGAQIMVRNLTERAEITSPAKGQEIRRMDLTGYPVEVSDGAVWRATPVSAIYTAPPLNIGTGGGGPGPLTLDAGNSQNAGTITSPASGQIQVADSGVYAFNMHCAFSPNVSGYLAIKNQAGTGTYALVNFPSGGEQSIGLPNLYLAAGAVVSFVIAPSALTATSTTIRITKIA